MKAIFPFTLVTLLVAIPAQAPACAIAERDGESIHITSEAALIVWDEASKTEHFIRRASFESTAYDFGFLVPTPSLPEVEESNDEAFSRLAEITKPRVEERTRTATLGCSASKMSAEFAASEVAGHADGVVLLQQKRVGDHDLVSLKFDPKAGNVEQGSKALADWLIRFGYGFGTTLKDWVAPYVKNDWVITAFRIAGDPNADREPKTGATARSGGGERRSRGTNTLRARPVRLSFKTDRPFYPYREPADQQNQKDSQPRMLKVFFASNQRFSGTVGENNPWPGRTVWADRIQDTEKAGVIAKAKLPANAGPQQWYLTEFEDRSSPRPGTDEVYFARSADQSPVARPPIIVWRETMTSWYIGLAVCLALPAITFLVLRLVRRA